MLKNSAEVLASCSVCGSCYGVLEAGQWGEFMVTEMKASGRGGEMYIKQNVESLHMWK
jgi:hypothetical protein